MTGKPWWAYLQYGRCPWIFYISPVGVWISTPNSGISTRYAVGLVLGSTPSRSLSDAQANLSFEQLGLGCAAGDTLTTRNYDSVRRPVFSCNQAARTSLARLAVAL